MVKNYFFTKSEDEGIHGLCIINQNGEVYYTDIDSEDVPKLKQHRWHVTQRGYVRTFINGRHTSLPEVIFNKKADSKMNYDHIDRDKLNNRKSNLRYGSYALNLANRQTENESNCGIRGITQLKTGSYRIKDRATGKEPTFKRLIEAIAAKIKSLQKQGIPVQEYPEILKTRIGGLENLEKKE